MLFDLRGRGRRRTVQAIYLTLAVLMGGGLVLFGIGGATSGGLLDALGIGSGGGNGTSASEQLQKQEKSAQRRTRVNPSDPTAWATLTRIQFQQSDRDQQTGEFTSDGRKKLAEAAASWQRYLALNPKNPDAGLAALMVLGFGPAGLNRPKDGTTAAEIVAEDRPSAQTYYQLAVFAYAAGQTRKGDLAGKKAVELAPKDQRATVKTQVDAAKSQKGFPSATGQ